MKSLLAFWPAIQAQRHRLRAGEQPEQNTYCRPLCGHLRARFSARRSLVCLWGFTFLTRIKKKDYVDPRGPSLRYVATNEIL